MFYLYVGKQARTEKQAVRGMTNLVVLWDYACDNFYNFIIRDEHGGMVNLDAMEDKNARNQWQATYLSLILNNH
jgi:predicted DCC family thiol-disulfide oxidoreductase YuxK